MIKFINFLYCLIQFRLRGYPSYHLEKGGAQPLQVTCRLLSYPNMHAFGLREETYAQGDPTPKTGIEPRTFLL